MCIAIPVENVSMTLMTFLDMRFWYPADYLFFFFKGSSMYEGCCEIMSCGNI